MTKLSLLDGAIGSELILRGETLPPHIWSAEVNLSNPDLLLNIYKEYINAGSNYITTNTFRTTTRAYKKTGLSTIQANEIAKKSMHSAISIAKRSANKSIKILGSIAPLEDCYSPQLFPGVENAKNEFSIIAKWLKEGGIDGYILETMNNITETQICLEVIQDYKLPVWVSFNLLDSYRIQSGETLENAINMTTNFDVDCILLNCNPVERTQEALKIISNQCSIWGIYPNLGIGEPSPDGVISKYYSDDEFLKLCKNAIDLGASVVGGCCGTSPRHIKILTDNFIK
jgi:homocysteine S-methyltransferase|tara:strand:+ start:1307 stop:2164 length:858 start_codon:yes stop_codon:yes gene_type:complete